VPGTNGTTGFTKTLPGEATETGTWSSQSNGSGTALEGIVPVSISFPIPLKEELGGSQVHYITQAGTELVSSKGSYEEAESTQCKGTAATPSAAPGNLCVYESVTLGFRPAEGPAALELACHKDQSACPEAEIFPSGTQAIFTGNPPEIGAGLNGALLKFIAEGENARLGFGTFAVTAPSE
jgi:hypothetical protein